MMPIVPGNALTGQMLKNRARELDIPGRSKMKADELREAVELREQHLHTLAGKNDPIDLSEPEVPPMVRMAETAKRLSAYEKSVVAGDRGNDPEPMDNSKRVAVYLAQNSPYQPYAIKLTHRQKRRIRKNERKARGLS